MRDVRCPVLVGRQHELEVLAEAIARAAGGDGAVAVVLGEAASASPA